MDQRILVVVLGIAALALAGLAFASPLGAAQFEGAGCACNGTNGSIGMRAQGGWENRTGGLGAGMRMGAPDNATLAAHEEFEEAVEAGDFASALALHEEYGFGGPIFGKLNETTFATFSQIHALHEELRQALGMEGADGKMMGRGPGGMGRMGGATMQGEGFGAPEGGMGSGKGMRNRFNQIANEEEQQ
ncbi:MAG: hypothetical protein WC717_05370 [Candidatus Micrarchaeia archaeon]|jgi:hypothetical protein